LKTLRSPDHAVLLAAGRGVRLRPLTDYTPKPLLQVNGRVTLDCMLRSAYRAGIEQACLVTHHLEQQIQGYVGDGSSWGLRVVYAHQAELLGTAHALRTVADQFPTFLKADRPFVLSATDYALPGNYLARLVHHHLTQRADITLSLKETRPDELARRSCVALGDGWQVKQIIEKPAPGEALSPYAASLTMVLPAQAVIYLERLLPTSRGELEWADLVNMMIMDGFTARGCLLPAPREFQL
jgi:NDP-sugar pyrophosphorylase family protein